MFFKFCESLMKQKLLSLILYMRAQGPEGTYTLSKFLRLEEFLLSQNEVHFQPLYLAPKNSVVRSVRERKSKEGKVCLRGSCVEQVTKCIFHVLMPVAGFVQRGPDVLDISKEKCQGDRVFQRSKSNFYHTLVYSVVGLGMKKTPTVW